MKVIIIGSGRVGTAFGYLLKKAGFYILGVYNRHHKTGLRALERLGEGTVYSENELPEAVPEAELIVITTPDGVIGEMVELIASSGPDDDACIMHMSGLLDSDLLKIDRWMGGVFSLHPLQAIADFDEGIKLLPEALYTIEGNEKGKRFALELARELNLDYLFIKKEYKPLYHTAAVIASNYLVTLLDASFNLLKRSGMDREKVKEGIINLVKGTLKNIENMDPVEALTGPVARGDVDTIRKHQQALVEYASDILELYQILGRYTAEMVDDGELKAFFNIKRDLLS